MAQNHTQLDGGGGTENALIHDGPQSTSDFTGASLKYSQVLGFNRVQSKTIEHVNDESICYLSGKHVAIYNYETKSHRFILKNSRTAEIVAFCVSANRRYIALSERLIEDSGVQVSVYNFATASRVRTLVMSYISKQPVIGLSFSLDNKYLATITSPPEVYVYLWQLDKARLLGTQDVPTPLSSVSISPWAHWQLCTTGPRDVILWKFQPTDAKRLKRSDPLTTVKGPLQNMETRYTCHAWFDKESVLVGTQDGDVVVIVKGEVQRVLTAVHGGLAVRCVAAVGRGFVCAGDRGSLALFERTYNKEVFQLYRQVEVAAKGVLDVSLSPSEDGVVCALDDNTFVHFALSNLDTLRDSVGSACTTLPIGFHGDAITAVDTCTQRSVVLTASASGVVRLWNFLRKTEEICAPFDDEVSAAALHPSGTRAVLGFKYRMGVYAVLRSDFHLLCDLPVKNCREVKFSHGGQFFVAVVLNRIIVFDSYTFETLGSLQGHGSMVRNVAWLPDDSGLVSAGLEGGLYAWKLDGMRRTEDEVMLKSATWTALVVDPSTRHIFAVCSNKAAEGTTAEGEVSLREFNLLGTGQSELAVTTQGMGISRRAGNGRSTSSELAISSSSNTLFVGTPNGQLLLFRFPLTPDSTPYHRYEVCNGEIVFVKLTPDERFLLVIGADNTLFFFEVDLVVAGRSLKRRAFNYGVFDDIAYVLVADDEERQRKLLELESHAEDLARGRDKDADRLRHDHQEQLKAVETAHAHEMTGLKTASAQAETRASAAEQAAGDAIKRREGVHLRALEEMELVYERRASEQERALAAMKAEREDAVVEGEMRLSKLARLHEEEVASLKEELELERKLRAMDQEQAARNEAAAQAAHMEELRQIEEDNEVLLEEMRLQDQSKVDQATAAARKANQRTSEIRTKFEEREREMLELRKRVQDADQALQRKGAKIEELARAQRALKKDVDVREDTIAASERKIHDMKKQCAELEKLRYVLTFKYNELRKEVAPKDVQISRLSGRVGEMDRELERVGHDAERYRQALSNRTVRLQAALDDGQANARRVEARTKLFELLLRDLADLVADPEVVVRHPAADGSGGTPGSAFGVSLPPVTPTAGGAASNGTAAASPLALALTRQAESPHHGNRPVALADGRRDAKATNELRRALVKLVESYRVRAHSDGPAPQRDATEEFERQRESLESQMTALRKQRLRREEHLRVDRHRKTIENVLLVQQVNELRQERKALQVKVASVEHDAVQTQLSRRAGRVGAGGAPMSPHPAPSSPTGRGVAKEEGGARAASVSPSRGRLHKGSTVTMRDLAVADPQRIAEIISQVDRNHREMQRQQDEIKRLRSFVQHLLAKAAVGGETASPALLRGLPGAAAATADAVGVDLAGDGTTAPNGQDDDGPESRPSPEVR